MNANISNNGPIEYMIKKTQLSENIPSFNIEQKRAIHFTNSSR